MQTAGGLELIMEQLKKKREGGEPNEMTEIYYHDETVETGRIAHTDGHVLGLQFKSGQ